MRPHTPFNTHSDASPSGENFNTRKTDNRQPSCILVLHLPKVETSSAEIKQSPKGVTRAKDYGGNRS